MSVSSPLGHSFVALETLPNSKLPPASHYGCGAWAINCTVNKGGTQRTPDDKNNAVGGKVFYHQSTCIDIPAGLPPTNVIYCIVVIYSIPVQYTVIYSVQK